MQNVITNAIDKSITLIGKDPKCSLIWLHGLGDKSEGFKSFFCHSHSPVYAGIKIKLIQAPERPVTINGGAVTNSWYDIKSLKRFTE
jgi:phospholipase/carboxylesterase